MASLIESQPQRFTRYVEPFAGGSGVGLRLLFDEYVDEIVLNDLNAGIAAFWRAVFFGTDELLDLLASCDVTVEEWHRQFAAYKSSSSGDLERGFATIFLNRTNRSGILDARPIGGLQQEGAWKIDARFNKQSLTTRIKRVAKYASRVTVCEEDGVGLIERFIDDGESFVYADPPYLDQGDELYLNTLSWDDHRRLADLLRDAAGWFLTYDADPRVPNVLYEGLRCAEFQTSHTAAKQHVGSEYAVFARTLEVPSLDLLGTRIARWIAP